MATVPGFLHTFYFYTSESVARLCFKLLTVPSVVDFVFAYY